MIKFWVLEGLSKGWEIISGVSQGDCSHVSALLWPCPAFPATELQGKNWKLPDTWVDRIWGRGGGGR
jgi:hypothetical protein